jgi:hypothetical protein
MHTWSLREAETQLQKIIAKTLSEGAQTIETQMDTQVVLLSREEYRRLQSPKPRFVEFMRQSPWLGVELDIQRDASPARNIQYTGSQV